MGDISLIFSVVFFIISALSVFFGIYTFIVNTNKKSRWTFLFVSLSFTVWALGLSVAISAPDERICLLWRQTSALGWGTFYSFLLHYIIRLTEKKASHIKWWVYVIIYLPAVVTLVAFSYYTGLNSTQYNLVHTEMGWINVAENTPWDIFYIIYYLSFTLIGLALLWRWGKNSSDISIKRQARVITSAIIVAIIMGTLSDILFNSVFNITIPQISPIIFLIPIIAIYYSIRKLGFMNPKIISKEETILNRYTLLRVFKYLSITFFAGGVLSILVQYIYNRNVLAAALPFTSVVCLFGLITYLVLKINIRETLKEILIVVVLCLSIPVILLKYSASAGLTIWAYPFILIIVTLVFSKRYILIAITVTTLLTQVIIWLITPVTTVQIDATDYVTRITFICIGACFALFENKACLLRLKENTEQTAYQKIISEILFDFLTASESRQIEQLKNILKDIGRFFSMDRAYVLLANEKGNAFNNVCEWCGENVQNSKNYLKATAPKDWRILKIEDANKLPDEANILKETLKTRGIISTVSVTIESEGIVYGFLGLDSVSSAKKWSDERLRMLRTFTNLIADELNKERNEKAIEHMAYYDQLTNIPNRILFKDVLDKAIEAVKNTKDLLGVIFLNLDGFKEVNNSMGHNDGDRLIKEVADTLIQNASKNETVSRFGRDEFIILIEEVTNIQDIENKALEIMKAFEKPFLINGQEIFITASAGAVIYPTDGTDADTLVKNANIAMYKAKNQGKNQFTFCTIEMKNEVQLSTMLTNSLYHAEERNELVIHYQPQVDLATGRIIGMEALLRWIHPQLGMISPVVFIPLAEKSGLINSIGNWVLRNACIQNKKWQDMGLPKLRMAVNLSVNQFKNPYIADDIKRIIEETGISPEYIDLEITESVAIMEPGYIIKTLNTLKKLGVSISIDDFGMEYSSLSRLKDIPADRIKIDMRFIKGVESDVKDQAITMIIINLAKCLGLKVLAEGVETATQLDFLRCKMCDEVQGFYYFKPMPAEDIGELLKRNKNSAE